MEIAWQIVITRPNVSAVVPVSLWWSQCAGPMGWTLTMSVNCIDTRARTGYTTLTFRTRAAVVGRSNKNPTSENKSLLTLLQKSINSHENNPWRKKFAYNWFSCEIFIGKIKYLPCLKHLKVLVKKVRTLLFDFHVFIHTYSIWACPRENLPYGILKIWMLFDCNVITFAKITILQLFNNRFKMLICCIYSVWNIIILLLIL